MGISVFANNRLNSDERVEFQAALRIVDHAAHHVGRAVNGNLKSRTRSLSHRAADLPEWLTRGKHEVKIKDFLSWLGRQGRSPAEVMLKQKLEKILGKVNQARARPKRLTKQISSNFKKATPLPSSEI
jgi:hypothetical protein